MREKFRKDLEELKREVEEMGELALSMLVDSVESLKNIDIERANDVISRKERLAEMDEKIEEKALTMISLYQPMAKDLRTIGAVLKMITYLYRIGRYGKDIAKITKALEGKQHIGKLVEIPYMAKKVEEMVRDALSAFMDEDISHIENFSTRDDELDSLNYSIFRECLTYMMEDPKKITQCSYYIMVSRYLERCGDHACKMAEKIYFMITGERVEIK
jgi:phosphate transport system protein